MASIFKKGDRVKVVAGDDKGKVSVILKVLSRCSYVLLEGVNVVKKHSKPSKANPDGGIINKEMPIHVSNVMHFDEKANSASRIGFRLDKGDKVRFFKKSGEVLLKNQG